MTQELFYAFTDTTAGYVGLLASDAGLLRVTLPQKSEREAKKQLGKILEPAVPSPQSFQDLIERLRLYFKGNRVEFKDRLDFSGATPFQREVWESARKIPYGETRSYGWLAGKIGKPQAARAVGQALGRNPFPVIVPCHRVLAADGGLGGFSGGIEMKRYLLSLEGVVTG
ncbi:MAG: methylated-DNA--[protein]-cysteine S-methyltransferase [Dehalococcoidales bacterium]|nr:methylated-DNA--[protein]-cysteine S-methyltransferase [Dehalococcoidales bacterium]